MGDGAGDGGVVGGARVGVGDGRGGALVGLLAGELVEPEALAALVAFERVVAAGDDFRPTPGVLADLGPEAAALGVDEGCAPARADPLLAGVVVEAVAVLAAVLANIVAMPHAPSTLSSAVRQVIRDSRRRPASRAAPLFRCLM